MGSGERTPEGLDPLCCVAEDRWPLLSDSLSLSYPMGLKIDPTSKAGNEEPMRSKQKVRGAWHTASLPEMSAIIRPCAGPGRGDAKTHFIQEETKILSRGHADSQVRMSLPCRVLPPPWPQLLACLPCYFSSCLRAFAPAAPPSPGLKSYSSADHTAAPSFPFSAQWYFLGAILPDNPVSYSSSVLFLPEHAL